MTEVKHFREWRAYFRIEGNKIEHNVATIRKITKNRKILAMVKANAYGHDLVLFTNFLFREMGIRDFGVACIEEGKLLRKSLSREKINIWVFSETQISHIPLRYFTQHHLIPVISSLNDLSYFLEHCQRNSIPLVIKLNTGMNRLGIAFNEIEKLYRVLMRHQRHHIDHLMTHFACADSSDPLNKLQLERFHDALNFFKSSQIAVRESSCANSAGILQHLFQHTDVVRPGLLLYGGNPLQHSGRKRTLNFQLVGNLLVKILKIEWVHRGTCIGYGAMPIKKSGILMIIGAGYGDGLFTYLQGVTLQICGYKMQVVGRVNMDMTYLLLEDWEDKLNFPFKVGDWLPLWDNSNDLKLIAKRIGTIDYALLTALSTRIVRHYL